MDTPNTEFTVTIDLVRGDPIKFKVNRAADEIRNLGATIEDAWMAKFIGLHADNKLVMIPVQNVASISIEPPPKVPMAHVITDAEMV